MNKKCTNCGKKGHSTKRCIKPITSYGVIAYCKHEGKKKYLLIRRKHSLGYIEFIRGRYFPDDLDTLTLLLKQMSDSEKQLLLKYDFHELWCKLWGESKIKNNFEYDISKKNFALVKHKFNELCKIESRNQEWGFPKGRMNYNETELKCALREFYEETNLKNVNLNIKNNLKTEKEYLIGTNGIEYMNIYFLVEIDYVDKLIFKSKEVSEIGLFTYEEAMSCFRDYHVNKKKLLSKINRNINIYDR